MERIPIRHINGTPKAPGLSKSFSIRDIPSFLAGKDTVQEIHRHDFFYILALPEGAGHHEIDFTPYTVCDKAVFVLRPGQVHRLVLKAGSTGYLMQFSADFYLAGDKGAKQLLHKATCHNYFQPDAARFEKLLAPLIAIFREYGDQQDKYQEVIKAHMRIFFIELLRQIPAPSASSLMKGLKPDTNDYAQEKLETFLALVETHAVSHKQVADYAAMLNLSTYQLNSVTKLTLGKTCSELINEYLLLEAKRYLLATSNQVSQIAHHLGYEDVSYFIRNFKHQTGYSPETFRKNFRDIP